MSYATFAGQTVYAASVSIPMVGAWQADVRLSAGSGAPLPSSPAELVIGNLSILGSVYRADSFAGVTSLRLVAGNASWSNVVPARGYHNAAGTLASQILADAATDCGESVRISTDFLIASPYARDTDQAAATLDDVSGGQWWIDGSGVTQVSVRPSSTIVSRFQIESYDGASGILRVATEDPASWLPGASFSSPTLSRSMTVGFVRHVVDAGGARLMIMAS